MNLPTINYLLLSFCFLFAPHLTKAQSIEWAGNIDADDLITQVDAEGYMYIAGSFVGTIDFDPGPAVYELTAFSDECPFLLKLDPEGNLMWAIEFDAWDFGTCTDMSLNEDGEIFITGSFKTILDCDPSEDEFLLENETSWRSCFIIKLNNDGEFIWAKDLESTGDFLAYSVGHQIRVDMDGNIYVSGGFRIGIDFDPGPGVYEITTNTDYGPFDLFVLKLDEEGNFLWAKSLGGNPTAEAPDPSSLLRIDHSGEIYLVGEFFGGPLDFDPSAAVTELTCVGTKNAFILKLDDEGDFIWVKQLAGTSAESVSTISDLASNSMGDLYLVGSFKNQVDFNPGDGIAYITSNAGSSDSFILRLSLSDGNFNWVEHFGNETEDYCSAVHIDEANNISIAGNFQGTVDLNFGVDVFNLTADSLNDNYVLQITSSSNFLWAKSIGTCFHNSGAYTINGDASNNLYVTGDFNQTIAIELTDGDYAHTTESPSNLNYESFLVKIPSFEVSSGIMDEEMNDSFIVYPNPTKNEITIAFDQKIEEGKVSVYSVSGQLLIEKIVKNDIEFILPLNVAPGIYILEIKNQNDALQQIKICKE